MAGAVASELLRIVEDEAQREAQPARDAAHAVAHLRAMVAARAGHGPRRRREHHQRAPVRRVEAAGRHIDVARLAVSPQCGFASTVAGNPVTLDTKKAKLALVQEVARRVWG